MKQHISQAFLTFSQEAPEHAKAWSEMVTGITEANILDPKTTALIYIGVLAALGLENGIPYHVQQAKQAGATKKDIIHAILISLPAAGNRVTEAVPLAVTAYDEKK